MRPDIFSYHDYRQYLTALFFFLKESPEQYSLRGIADRLDVSVAQLSMILSGQRNLTPALIKKFKSRFKIAEDEAEFLTLLTVLSDDDDPKARIAALKKLQKYEQYQAQNKRELEVYTYLTKWYFVAIRELAALPNFKAEVDWIQEKLSAKLTPAQIREALEYLIGNGFLVKSKSGTYKSAQKSLECFNGVYRLSLAQFHSQMFEQGIDSIHRDARDERMILGYTLCVSQSGYDKISELIQETLKKVQEIEAQDGKPERLYHVGLAAFPLSKKGSLK